MEHQSQILIVDDMEINRAILCELFREDYGLLEAENGQITTGTARRGWHG